MQRRELFESKIAPISQHFVLNIMFRSLSDKVEPFLNNEAVLKFDTKLPSIDETEVTQIETELKSQLSELNIKSSSSFSATTSSSSGTSSGSLTCSSTNTTNTQPVTTSGSSPDSETTLLDKKSNFWNELNIFEMNDPDLNMLNSLIDLLNTDSLPKELFKHLNNTNHDTKSTNTTNNEANNLTEIKRMFEFKINDLRAKLNETKDLLRTYQNELKVNVESILAKQDETEKLNETNRAKFYSNLLDLVKSSPSDSSQTTRDQFLIELTNSLDKQFSMNLLDCINKRELENQKQIDELKQTIKTVKTTSNADKQIQFNEAIKRVQQDKDKVIEDFKQKEKAYLDQISSLQAQLDAANNMIKDVSNDTVLISNEKSKPLEMQRAESPTTPTEKDNAEVEDITQTKIKLRELLLMEKISQLEKQLSKFTTLPVTNDFETIQLYSCNIDDLVIAVYSEHHGSYKIIHKSSNYLHFVHSAIFKSHEQRLSFKNPNSLLKQSQMMSVTMSPSTSPITTANEMSQLDIQFPPVSGVVGGARDSSDTSASVMCSAIKSEIILTDETSTTTSLPNPLVKNSPSDNIHNIFLSEKQPQWFVGRVLVKEFCIARKVI